MSFTKTQTAVLTVGGLCRQILSGDGTGGSGSSEGPAMAFNYQQAIASANCDGWVLGEWNAVDGDYIQMADSTPFRHSNTTACCGATTQQPSGYSAVGSRVAFFFAQVVGSVGAFSTNYVSLDIPAAATPHGGYTNLAVASGTAAVLTSGDACLRTFNYPQNQLQTTIGDRVNLAVASTTGSIPVRVAIGYRTNAYTP